MVKKTVAAPSITEWDSSLKEPWHLNFEKEPVNDERWTCIVTAAVQAQAQDEECIQIFTHCASTGLRKAIKVLSMADVIKLLRGNPAKDEGKKKEEKSAKNGKIEKPENPGPIPPPPRSSEIVALAARYATFTDVECKLPADLMAAVLKYMILNLKDEHCFWKRVDATRAKRKREEEIKSKFIRDLKPYEMKQEEKKSDSKIPPNLLGLSEPINDEPYGGPDLYIMLTDFYDVFCFPELLKINVPFVALLKITHKLQAEKWSHTSVAPTAEPVSKKGLLVAEFWEKLKKTCIYLEDTVQFKDIAMMQYQVPPFRNVEAKNQIHGLIFDELSWMMYSAYCIYRQHQKYLQELEVQRLVLSFEPLDLSTCDLYNKLCDALVTGEPSTPCLVLYAMIEQVLVGVPHTESAAIEYEPRASDVFSLYSDWSAVTPKNSSPVSFPDIRFKVYDSIPPCRQCRDKKWTKPSVCEPWRKSSSEDYLSELSQKNEWTPTTTTITEENEAGEEVFPESNSSDQSKQVRVRSEEFRLAESLVDQVLKEKKTEKELREDRKWSTPALIFHGDSITLQTFHCDSRIFDPVVIIERFLKNSSVSRIWSKYPELPPEERAFYNYHFFSLWKASQETEESLKLKIFFTLSMKLIEMIKSYLYRGEEQNMSEMVLGKEKYKKSSKVKFEQTSLVLNPKGNGTDFSSYFFKTFIVDMYLRGPRKTVIALDNLDLLETSLHKAESFNLRMGTSHFNIYLMNHPSSGVCLPHCPRNPENRISSSSSVRQTEKVFPTLLSLLECFDIYNLTEPTFLNDRDDYVKLIQDFKFFEELEPDVMVQRLLEAEGNYNTTQCSYFAPTDTLIIVMNNDFDHRGVFFTHGYGALPTPVTLRDFYNYVYPEISDWLLEEDEEYTKLMTELQEKAQELKEKNEAEYLLGLKRYFCGLSNEEKFQFLEQKVEEVPELDDDLEDLPWKPKLRYPSKVSFVTTNFLDVRVETRRKLNEYYSGDGTVVTVTRDSWLYDPHSLLTLAVKRSKMKLIYHQLLGSDDLNTSFSFRTDSDILFGFFKDSIEDGFNYHVRISWPVGLLIEGIPHESAGIAGMYLKQGYMKIYRRGWDIEQEKYRCHLKNGQVLIFKENGDVEILTGSGTIYSLFDFRKPRVGTPESILFSRCETTTPCGEVWEKVTKGPCRNKKKIVNAHKVLLGVDPKTGETFYRRDDGVQSMLWPSGKLVTQYPDGTKITTIPDFDEAEVFPDWSEEEKLKMKEVGQAEQAKSRTILRKSSKTNSERTVAAEGFVFVSCRYLVEHPKYSSVSFGGKDDSLEVRMPEQITIKMHPEGNYQIRQKRNVLDVRGSTVEFSRDCGTCNEKSVATLYLDSSEILCSFIDFFQKMFCVQRNGETSYRDLMDENVGEAEGDGPENSCINARKTSDPKCDHQLNVAGNQRCFALERDLGGIEFIHANSLAKDSHLLPDDTFFELDSRCNDFILGHTFSSPHYKVGHETWVMEFEDKSNCVSTNIKKKDLKEMGVKDNGSKLYKHPFPKHLERKEHPTADKPRQEVKMPKVIETRLIKSFSRQPKALIDDLQKHVAAYQKRAQDICKAYRGHKQVEYRSQDSRYVKMRLRKIALTLNQSLSMYPHLCSQHPSTEKDIHYFGHFVSAMDALKDHFDSEVGFLPDCSQIPKPLPRSSDFPCIDEENDS